MTFTCIQVHVAVHRRLKEWEGTYGWYCGCSVRYQTKPSNKAAHTSSNQLSTSSTRAPIDHNELIYTPALPSLSKYLASHPFSSPPPPKPKPQLLLTLTLTLGLRPRANRPLFLRHRRPTGTRGRAGRSLPPSVAIHGVLALLRLVG